MVKRVVPTARAQKNWGTKAALFLFDESGLPSNVRGMNITALPASRLVSSRRCFSDIGSKFFALLMVLLLGVSLNSAWADALEDDYLSILNLIDQGDMLTANGKGEAAQVKYVEAEKRLTELKRANPTFSPPAVAYRMKYLAAKIAPAPAKAAPETAKGASAVEVKLISAGGEPRKALRLHPQAGDKQSLGMTIKVSMEVTTDRGTMPAIKMPAMQMGLDVLIKEVSGGDINYESTIVDATMAEDADTAPQMAGAFEAAMANLKGMSITGVTTDRGVSKSVDFKLPPGANQRVQQTMEQVKTATSQVSLPEEAVGVGAQWSVRRKLKTQGMLVDQTETYEITALEDDSVTLKTGITQTAANQKIESPAMPGMKVDISKMETKGTGTATINLGKLLPTAGTMEGHTEMNMGMDMGGQKQTMSMKMDMTATIESK